jgi:hypothetical protein
LRGAGYEMRKAKAWNEEQRAGSMVRGQGSREDPTAADGEAMDALID